MKIRTGFVSNSSSSSFVILGLCYQDSEQPSLKMLVEKAFPNIDFTEPFQKFKETREKYFKSRWEEAQEDNWLRKSFPTAESYAERYMKDYETFDSWLEAGEGGAFTIVFRDLYEMLNFENPFPEFQHVVEDDESFFGIFPESIPDNLTLGEVKEGIKRASSNLGLPDKEVKWHERITYNY